MLECLDVDVVLHCGDIGSSGIVDLFHPWPTHFVFGNVDQDTAALQTAIAAAGQSCHGRLGLLELAGRRIALLHGDDTRQLAQLIRANIWDLICYGHTHRYALERQGNSLVLNPGALFRATPHTLAVVELKTLVVLRIAL